jgi:hypothetical protein
MQMLHSSTIQGSGRPVGTYVLAKDI